MTLAGSITAMHHTRDVTTLPSQDVCRARPQRNIGLVICMAPRAQQQVFGQLMHQLHLQCSQWYPPAQQQHTHPAADPSASVMCTCKGKQHLPSSGHNQHQRLSKHCHAPGLSLCRRSRHGSSCKHAKRPVTWAVPGPAGLPHAQSAASQCSSRGFHLMIPGYFEFIAC